MSFFYVLLENLIQYDILQIIFIIILIIYFCIKIQIKKSEMNIGKKSRKIYDIKEKMRHMELYGNNY